jgi:hypothetical protein
VWAGTDQYRSGKYVRDGVYDPDVIDSQAGCAGLLMAMKALDPAITFTGATQPSSRANASAPAAPKRTAPTPSRKTPTLKIPALKIPTLKTPSLGSIGAGIASILFALLAVFKPKGK